MRVEFIQWYDAGTDDGWEALKDAKEHKGLTYTVGFVIRETKQAIILASTWDHESDLTNCRITIPVNMIKKRRVMWTQKMKTP